jgi:hypothetical protein
MGHYGTPEPFRLGNGWATEERGPPRRLVEELRQDGGEESGSSPRGLYHGGGEGVSKCQKGRPTWGRCKAQSAPEPKARGSNPLWRAARSPESSGIRVRRGTPPGKPFATACGKSIARRRPSPGHRLFRSRGSFCRASNGIVEPARNAPREPRRGAASRSRRGRCRRCASRARGHRHPLHRQEVERGDHGEALPRPGVTQPSSATRSPAPAPKRRRARRIAPLQARSPSAAVIAATQSAGVGGLRLGFT